MNNYTPNNSGSSESLSPDILPLGTENNIRWEVTNVNINNGTFNLSIRRGDDNSKNKVILESWNNLSLDPNSPNYIKSVIGDTYYVPVQDGDDYYVKSIGSYPNKSNYVRVSSVSLFTPDYSKNPSLYTSYLPIISNGVFTGATGSNTNITGDRLS